MADVLSFPGKDEPEDRIWTCGACGCKNFELHEDGTTECASCGLRGEGGAWHLNVVEVEKHEAAGERVVIDRGTADFARAHVLKKGNDPDTMAVIIIKRDGRVSAWGDVEVGQSEDQKAWVRRHCLVGAALLNGEPPPPPLSNPPESP